MENTEKSRAVKKADVAICKLQDIFYLNPTDRISTRLTKALDAVRELQYEIENTQTKKKTN